MPCSDAYSMFAATVREEVAKVMVGLVNSKECELQRMEWRDMDALRQALETARRGQLPIRG